MKTPKDDELRGLVERHQSALIGYAFHFLREEQAAKDAVQWAFLKLIEQDWSAVRAKIPQWLFLTVRNRCIDHLRSPSNKKESGVREDRVISPLDFGFEEALVLKDVARVVLSYVQRLPENQQEAILLKYRSDLSNEEISEILGISRENAAVMIFRGLSKLRDLVKENHPELFGKGGSRE